MLSPIKSYRKLYIIESSSNAMGLSLSGPKFLVAPLFLFLFFSFLSFLLLDFLTLARLWRGERPGSSPPSSLSPLSDSPCHLFVGFLGTTILGSFKSTLEYPPHRLMHMDGERSWLHESHTMADPKPSQPAITRPRPPAARQWRSAVPQVTCPPPPSCYSLRRRASVAVEQTSLAH